MEEVLYHPDCRHHHHHAVHYGTPIFVVFELSPAHRTGKKTKSAHESNPDAKKYANYATVGVTSVSLGNDMKVYDIMVYYYHTRTI